MEIQEEHIPFIIRGLRHYGGPLGLFEHEVLRLSATNREPWGTLFPVFTPPQGEALIALPSGLAMPHLARRCGNTLLEHGR